MFLLALSFAPGLMLLLYIYLQDKYEREPLKVVLQAFVWGAASALILIIIYLVFKINILDKPDKISLFKAFILALKHAAIPEELVKFLPFLFFIYKNREFNEWFDGIVYASAISLGFATVENIIYVLSGGSYVGILRAFTAVPGHFVMGITQGFFFSLAKFRKYKILYISLALICAILVHALYDAFLFSGKKWLLSLFIIYLISIIYLGKKMIKSHLEKSQFK